MTLSAAAQLDPELPERYRLSTGARAGYVVLGLFLLAMPAFILITLEHSAAAEAAVRLLRLALVALALLGLWLVVYAWRWCLTLTPTTVAVRGVFRTRTLARADIAGRRLFRSRNGTSLVLEPTVAARGALRFSPNTVRTDARFDAWIDALPDLDERDRVASEARIAADPQLGPTPAARQARVATARKVTGVFTVVSFAAAFWLFLYPLPYAAAVCTAAALPWAALALAASSAGLYRLDTDRNDVRPTLAGALLLPGLALATRAAQDIGLLDWPRALAWALAPAALLMWVAWRISAGYRAETPRARRAVPLWLLLAGVYGFGVVVLGNALLDHSGTRRFTVQVLGQHINRGRNISFHLTLAPWGVRNAASDVSVTRALYQNAQLSHTVCIRAGDGALGIPWFVVRSCS